MKMVAYNDKDRIGFWLRLYNRLEGETYAVESWPDDDSSKKNIDALCRNGDGRTLAVEHTLIEPYAGNKADIDPFLKTLGALEDHPLLKQQGYMLIASQAVGAVPRGIKWVDVPQLMVPQLAAVLPGLPEGLHTVTVTGPRWSLNLNVSKRRTAPGDSGSFFTARVYPGDPGPELIIAALEKKIPKLAAASADKKILLLEKDAAAGTIEAQFDQLPDEPRIRALLGSIDQIWGINSAALESEDVIFTNQIFPPLYDHANYCSLELGSDKFWQVSR
jgi:hypothetical protein